MTEPPPQLLLLGRPGCGLCDEMLADLLQAFAGKPLHLETADVDTDDTWRRRYGLRIPVVLDAWGEVVFEGRFSAEAFDDYIAGLKPG